MHQAIALFGGTFDPPHRGHAAVARACAEKFNLDTIVFAPVGLQPLKPNGPAASFADRLAMCNLLCAEENAHAGRAHFQVSNLDAPRADGQPNFTIDTLRSLRKELEMQGQGDPTLFVIVGADSFLDIRRWRELDALLSIADWIVVSRPGFSARSLTPLALTPEQFDHVHLLENVHEPASATEVRRRLSSGRDCADLLTPRVLHYIQEHRLYATPLK